MTILQSIFTALREAFLKMMNAIKKFWKRFHLASRQLEKQQVKERVIQSSPAIKWDMRRKSQVIDKRPFFSHKKVIGRVRR